MVHKLVVIATIAASLSACEYNRAVARPVSPAGYQHVKLRDAVATAMNNANVELDATVLGTSPSDSCGGLVMLTLTAPGVSTGNVAPAFGVGGLTATIPRARYAEVRDLPALTAVHVRGYLSNGFAEHCRESLDDTSARFLWIDTIERR